MGFGRIEFVEHTADVAMRVIADDYPALLEHAARGLYRLVGDLVGQGEPQTHILNLRAQDAEQLLHDWLSEVLYWYDVREVVFEAFEFPVLRETELEARLVGRRLDAARSTVHLEIKAITYHQLRIERRETGVTALVVLDI